MSEHPTGAVHTPAQTGCRPLIAGQGWALTVAPMLFIFLGVALGFAVAAGPLMELRAPADQLVESLMGFAYEMTAKISSLIADTDQVAEHGLEGWAAVIGIALVAATPGMVAAVLAVAAKGSMQLRRAVSLLLLVGACASFAALPATQALTLLATAAVFATLLATVQGLLLVTPLVAVATMIGVRHVHAIVEGTDPAIVDGQAALAELVGTSGDPWTLVLVVVALAPFAAAAWRLAGVK